MTDQRLVGTFEALSPPLWAPGWGKRQTREPIHQTAAMQLLHNFSQLSEEKMFHSQVK